MWDLRSKTNQPRGKEREVTEETLLTISNRLMVNRGEVGVGWLMLLMGIMDFPCDKHRVLYECVE